MDQAQSPSVSQDLEHATCTTKDRNWVPVFVDDRYMDGQTDGWVDKCHE